MPPAGYERLLLGHAIAVARSDLAASVRSALIGSDGGRRTLLEYARAQPEARRLPGRGGAPAFAVPLPLGGVRAVVRHNRHGGLFARVTRDLFFAPTRAPRELATAIALRALDVPTPEVLAYAAYPPGGLLQRSDVCTREIPAARDLGALILHERGDARFAGLAAAAALVATLARAGARHPDLNAKNILLTMDRAYVLDVDRVTLGEPTAAALDANLARLIRSLRKWREQFGAVITEPEIARLESDARRLT
jgi:tRNA A-37 threonylcarbamoyl transferase component Bud32